MSDPSPTAPSAPSAPSAPCADVHALLQFLFRLAQAYLACGEQTAEVERILRGCARAYGMRGARIVAFPTAVFISLDDGSSERVTLAEGPAQALRLDQIGDVYELGSVAQRGAIAPVEGQARLDEILRKTERFGVFGVVAGHAILSVGLAMVLVPAVPNLVAAALLGLVVGALKSFRRNRSALAVPLPVVSAALVSAIVYLAVKWGAPLDAAHALVPPLVTFLPGAMLTLGMVELAFGDMVSGSSRLVTGFVQLVLLAFGLAAGAALVGVSADRLIEPARELDMHGWIPWAGVVVFGLGVYLHFSAPRSSILWMLVVLLLAFAVQRLATEAFGNEISGFFGMLVTTPLAYLIQTRLKGPPAMVTFLPSFWLMVPGSLGLISVTRMLTDRAAGLEGLTTAVFVFASMALGTLTGASLHKWLTERIG
jgi:uncharacterized membrane protein YjjP (DUF1212 family)/uncharacterized membrane protein YjjB (DUF3815 family)